MEKTEITQIVSQALRTYFADHRAEQQEIADKTGSSQPTISGVLSGRQAVSKKLATALNAAYGFDINFLLTGAGQLHPFTRIDHNEGSNIIAGSPGASINAEKANAALKAENERLRDEVAWLRGLLADKH